jgi:hypothetical protein
LGDKSAIEGEHRSSESIGTGKNDIDGGKDYWVSFRYERLPFFCFNCGRVRHGVKGCRVKKSQRRHEEEGPKPWGLWLRAEEPRRRSDGGDFL